MVTPDDGRVTSRVNEDCGKRQSVKEKIMLEFIIIVLVVIVLMVVRNLVIKKYREGKKK